MSEMVTKPLIGITVGDPVGIGPEVVAKTLVEPEIYTYCRPVVIGRSELLRREAHNLRLGLSIQSVTGDIQSVQPSSHVTFVWETGPENVLDLAVGELNPDAGRAAYAYAVEAAQLALDHKVDALATAPMNKTALSRAGIEDIGHLEIYTRMSGVNDTATMLAVGPYRVVHLSTHVPLGRAAEQVTFDRVLARLRLTHKQFHEWGLDGPKIGVAALNPHGGDDGLIGNEEATAISPAIEEAQKEGIDAHGPFPVDSMFPQARDGRWDAILVHYHDQGHIPIKMHDFEGSVSLNLGMPFTRTSVDHGTAFDIAGQGIADPTGMIAAVKLAARLVSGQGFVT